MTMEPQTPLIPALPKGILMQRRWRLRNLSADNARPGRVWAMLFDCCSLLPTGLVTPDWTGGLMVPIGCIFLGQELSALGTRARGRD